jgi:hypothetical protein
MLTQSCCLSKAEVHYTRIRHMFIFLSNFLSEVNLIDVTYILPHVNLTEV